MGAQGVDIKRQSIGNQQEQLSDVLLTLQYPVLLPCDNAAIYFLVMTIDLW